MEELQSYRAVLQSHNLRVTTCRLSVLDYFNKYEKALSQGDLEQQFKQFDRVTLYRTLKSFLDSGILHKIPNASGVATYGLCHHTCSPDHHNHNHIHFKCNSCGQIECLEDKAVPSVSAPEGYQVEAINMIIDGICVKCTK